MKIQQLRYLVEIVKQGLSISEAAEKLNTSQPGISKQIRLLEEELGVQIFIRNGKRMREITTPGRKILAIAERILMHAHDLEKIADDFNNIEGGEITIATTHTQARYALPGIIRQFTQRYPKICLHIRQSHPKHIFEMVVNGEADIAIATEGSPLFSELTMLSCHPWKQSIIAPNNHPLLTATSPLTLQDIMPYPLITYDSPFAGRIKINQAFEKENLVPNIVLTAIDSDIIKTYVELGLGVGILASMAYDSHKDKTLTALEADHLFEPSITRVGFRKDAYFRKYIYDFIELFTSKLTRPIVEAAMFNGTDQR